MIEPIEKSIIDDSVINNLAIINTQQTISYLQVDDTASDSIPGIPTLNVSLQQHLAASYGNIPLVISYDSLVKTFDKLKAEFEGVTDEVLIRQFIGEAYFQITNKIVSEICSKATYVSPWIKTAPDASIQFDYNFTIKEKIQELNQVLYRNTRRNTADYYLISADIKPILVVTKILEPAVVEKFNGTYLAGYIDNKPVYICPTLEHDFVAVVNATDGLTSAAIVSRPETDFVKLSDDGNDLVAKMNIDVVNPSLIVGFKVIE